VLNDAAVPRAEDDAPEADPLGASRSLCFGELARAHCKEVGAEGYVGGLGVSWVLGRSGVPGEQLVKFSKELWGDLFLAPGGGSALSNAFRSDRTVGSSWELPSR
jgi:hypothetical protein